MKKGFTLLEVLIAFAILSLVSGFFFLLFGTVISNATITQKFISSLNIAQAQMEELKSKNFEETKSKTFANTNGKIDVSTISDGLLEIYLIYNWEENHKPIEIYSLRSKS
ncbi:hypothetical protein A3J90_08735 [candidate division WOR-1 bacterium RIFOXYC2_FULL_37_10]|uniref:Type II secretion system protein GspI C-terminal domain-containing protein n=1 Tax=candidate division WOR-1 bacterium RIFOXYB2_FULL_37_13 TaxID=1802579 RepID=A0A1F4SQP7_UNCSA|nr:MAG: hypothetical protein A2246_05570 [candidate division WOR-1 bacterium RIFOXYA2_FULL_37_7]OGC22033.1 MAG: hypothetical protein A2310_07015 [candidate division WOR-1 bacterium RIFOXYB2_FULL_37_13]OGC33061.1 MAG: hypothetical protein A3J90_08735 [candidate division WOR-1 bacterium RIFOXYC2_FULL_37_10]